VLYSICCAHLLARFVVGDESDAHHGRVASATAQRSSVSVAPPRALIAQRIYPTPLDASRWLGGGFRASRAYP
jgi:hypothetical protein